MPESSLPKVSEYAFSFWFRFSYVKPKRIYFNDLAKNWFSIAGVTERDNFCVSNEHGFRALSLWLSEFSRACQPSFQLSTYDLQQNRSNSYQNLLIERNSFDMKWNFVYFGFSANEKMAFAYFRTQENQFFTLEWRDILHNLPPPALKFRLGNCQKDRMTLNGQYLNPWFSFQDGQAFTTDTQSIEQRLALNAPPKFYQNPKNTYTLFGANEMAFRPDDVKPHFFQLDDVNGYLEYSVFGWAKWTDPATLGLTQRNRHFVFRFATTPPEYAGSNNTEGDRTLACWVEKEGLVFATYNLGFDQPSVLSLEEFVPIEDIQSELQQWHFIYFGYKYETKKALAYVKFQSREHLVLFNDVWHVQSRFFGVSLGRDRFDSDSCIYWGGGLLVREWREGRSKKRKRKVGKGKIGKGKWEKQKKEKERYRKSKKWNRKV